ncbi:hypothetical protein [Desulfonema magnum]|uniref:Uncharacterized protein n=1 Tax=Desulfonema magnum TaxID=45655 RepID=A0A975BPG0_9BACT|nr:hypothetical protein [Desulfonema magnum]QTA89464.1 Uncharacterized protein dnm_055200 [Desulfonema magnum]
MAVKKSAQLPDKLAFMSLSVSCFLSKEEGGENPKFSEIMTLESEKQIQAKKSAIDVQKNNFSKSKLNSIYF